MTVEEILRFHAAKYPSMRPTDAVKLLYQNEFGGGHLIEDPERSLAWIEKEYAGIEHDETQPLTVPIGNGIVRYNLHAIDTNSMPLVRLNEVFVESSRLVRGNMESFREKLGLLVIAAEDMLFAFSSGELREYLSDYEKRGCPPVTHSPEFRRAYAPAYRVVLQSLLPLDSGAGLVKQ